MTNHTASSFSREKENSRNLPSFNNYNVKPFSPVETSNSNAYTQNNSMPAMNNFGPVSLQNYSMSSNIQQPMGTNNNMASNFQSFSGFNMNIMPSNTNQSALGNPSMMNQNNQNIPNQTTFKRSVENKPPVQVKLFKIVFFFLTFY